MDVAAWWDGGRRLRLAGHELFVRSGGPDDAPGHTTFVHGFPTSSFDWAPVLAHDPPRRRWTALDLLGFGASDKPAGHPYRIVEQASFVEDLWHKQGIAETALVAHDLGASVAQELLARVLDGTLSDVRITHVCFLNGGLVPAAHRPVRVQRLLAGRAGGLLGRLTTERTVVRGLKGVMARPPSDAELHEHWLAIARDQGHRRSHELLAYLDERRRNDGRWVGALTRTEVPLSFVWGPLDPVSGAHMAEAIRRLRPDADLVELPGVGHFPQLEDVAGVHAALRARELL